MEAHAQGESSALIFSHGGRSILNGKDFAYFGVSATTTLSPIRQVVLKEGRNDAQVYLCIFLFNLNLINDTHTLGKAFHLQNRINLTGAEQTAFAYF